MVSGGAVNRRTVNGRKEEEAPPLPPFSLRAKAPERAQASSTTSAGEGRLSAQTVPRRRGPAVRIGPRRSSALSLEKAKRGEQF
uniref:Uncharacterized protein n=1 Tax=Knipowitschia caucasica TaxID=637954 RepID=A0AAV2J6M1_KNICA